MLLPNQQTSNIQLSGEAFSCFVQLPIEIKAAPLSEGILITSSVATWTLDAQRIAANAFGPSAPKGGR